MILASAAFWLSGYGYGPEQDPLVIEFKLVAAHARSGAWGQASEALTRLEPSVREIEGALGVSLMDGLERALQGRDPSGLARQLTTLAYYAVWQKLEACRREGLTRYYPARYRIEAARGYYMELLAPAVRRRDQKSGGDAHERVSRALSAAQAALGKPGFLGRGVVAPDPDAFETAMADVASSLRAALSFLPEVTP